MNSEIYIRPDQIEDLWELEKNNLISEPQILAEDEENEVEIDISNIMGECQIVIFQGNDPVDSICSSNMLEIEDYVRDSYQVYIPALYRKECPDSGYSEIDEREEYLRDAGDFFLMAVCDDKYYELTVEEIDELSSDVTEKVCKYLATEYGIPIYRPKIVAGVLQNYPYNK